MNALLQRHQESFGIRQLLLPFGKADGREAHRAIVLYYHSHRNHWAGLHLQDKWLRKVRGGQRGGAQQVVYSRVHNCGMLFGPNYTLCTQ